MADESPKKPRKWYQKKRYLIPLGTLALVAALGGGSTDTQIKPQTQVIPVVQTTTAPQNTTFSPIADPIKTQAPTPSKTTTSKPSGLSNNNYYTNVDGNSVHSPAYSNSVPPGASAQCRDGTYSFSQNRRGTCSHHGGVKNWIN